jgi:CubicO group peptidase (beta-lactamase class C family)
MWTILRRLAIATVTATIVTGGSTAASAPQISLPGQPVLQREPRHELTETDADAWLDGFMRYALAQGDIAGQLVEQGKIDLDADVNRYLDFQIPPFDGRPITMRNIMTHTSGFEEAFKGGIRFSGTVPPLGEVVKHMLPERVFAPGTTPAYSNYATAVAGYIVERVSGMSFEDYIERNIFQRLGMTHSSFRQPLPPQLAPYMSKGYPQASVDARPFELISVPPAGSLSMSAAGPRWPTPGSSAVRRLQPSLD